MALTFKCLKNGALGITSPGSLYTISAGKAQILKSIRLNPGIFGMLFDSCEAIIGDGNVVGMSRDTLVLSESSGAASFFNNQTASGVLLQAYENKASPPSPARNELTTDANTSVILST